MDDTLEFAQNPYHMPYFCSKCSGVMVYKGVGEYQCEKCRNVEYDDFGKVRNFIEEHKGATAAMISQATGVSDRSIRQMLREERLEVSADSKSFLKCEVCGKEIRSGRLCVSCERAFHERIEAQNRNQTQKNIQGFAQANLGESGQRRFERKEK